MNTYDLYLHKYDGNWVVNSRDSDEYLGDEYEYEESREARSWYEAYYYLVTVGIHNQPYERGIPNE